MPSDKKLNSNIYHLVCFSTSLNHSLCTVRGPVCVMPCYKPMLARKAEGRVCNVPMFLTRNDESEERHRLPYVWHSRSTWAVSATTEHTDCATKGGRCQTVCQWLHMLSMHGPCRQSRACRDALTEINPLSGVLFTSCLDWVCVVAEHRESGGYRTGRGGEQGDVSPKKETKKEPHDVWLFIQTNESAQGRPAGLVATLLAAVLPPWRPEVTTSLRTRGAYSTGSRGVGAGAAAGVAMGA